MKLSENWNDIQSSAVKSKTGKNWSLNWPFIVDVTYTMQWFLVFALFVFKKVAKSSSAIVVMYSNASVV